MTERWTFHELATGETYTVPINPDAMTSPFGDRQAKTATTTHDPNGRIRTFMSATTPVQWEFSGAIRTQAHHEALETWAKKPGLIRVTDHLGRTFEVLFVSYEASDRRPTRSTPWRLRYVMKASLLRRTA